MRWRRAFDQPAEFALVRPGAERANLAGGRSHRTRCGFDRLAERVKTVIGQDPLGGHLFVFRSRRGDRLKILVWDRDGFVLWYKRLEAGVFKLPKLEAGTRSVELRASELAMVLDGIDMSRLRRAPRYELVPGARQNHRKGRRDV